MPTMWKIAIAFLVIVLLTIGAIYLLTAGEEGKVREAYEEMLSAAQAYDADKLEGFVSKAYEHKGQTHDDFVKMIHAYVRKSRYSDLQERESPSIAVLGNDATVDAYLIARMGYPYPYPFNVHLELTKEGGDWKVLSAEARSARSQ